MSVEESTDNATKADSSAESDEEHTEIDFIFEQRGKGAGAQFRVKWKGWTLSHNSDWYPRSSITASAIDEWKGNCTMQHKLSRQGCTRLRIDYKTFKPLPKTKASVSKQKEAIRQGEEKAKALEEAAEKKRKAAEEKKAQKAAKKADAASSKASSATKAR